MVEQTASQPTGEQVEITLTRDLKLLDITMIGVGAMIGAGIFALTGEAASVAGPAFLLAFFLNGIVTLFAAGSYAELGSSFPEAGGGYLWVKEGMNPLFGFLSGWMSWFAHAVACSLYSLAFGEFAVNLLVRAGLFPLGSNETLLPVGFAVAIAATFSFVNLRGSSETGAVGNIVTVAKVFILGIFVVVGLLALTNLPNWQGQLTPFFHRESGLGGVFLAMGLTFIAFEGYEIIAQSGEEVVDPKRNIPRAIFFSIAIVVTIYLAVGFIALTAVQPADGRPTWMFLGGVECEEIPGACPADYQPLQDANLELVPELAIINAAETFMGSWGSILLLFGGLASAMSALNATIYSSSRVSFAMGRDRTLPEIFGRIHPRFRTPHYAIGLSAVLIIGMDILLLGSIKDVATSADIMFLLLFLMVNFSVITLRARRPDLDRGFRVPLVPWVPLTGIVLQLLLAINLLNLSLIAWIVAAAWIVIGLNYYNFSAAQRRELPKEVQVVHQEIVSSVSRYSVLVPAADVVQARQLGVLATALAQPRNGEVFAVHVVGVPQALSLADGRYFLKQGIPILEKVIEAGQERDVPVNTMIRLGRDVGHAILETARERHSNLIVLGWPGYTHTERAAFGSVIDLIGKNPPCDLAVVRFREREIPRRILVPTTGGPHTDLSLQLAIAQARAYQVENGQEESEITLMTIITPNMNQAQMEAIHDHYRERYGWPFRSLFKENGTVLDAILDESYHHNLIMIGATQEGIFEQRLFGNLVEQLARESVKTVIMCKAHDPVRHLVQRLVNGSQVRPAP